jgi:hypothetical protein
MQAVNHDGGSKFMRLAARLPSGRTLEDMAKRNEIFHSLDVSRSGYISDGDIQTGLRNFFKEELNVQELQTYVTRAFAAAKSVQLNHHGSSAGRVDKGEFRLLLLHMKQSLELRAIFDETGAKDPHYFRIAEATAALPLLTKWGLSIGDPVAAFDEIDPRNAGQVFFIFCTRPNP